MLTGPLNARVRDQIVAETRGNPLALLELPRGLTPAKLAGRFGLPGAVPLLGTIEKCFRRRVDALPDQTRRLLQLAAADPTGDPGLVWRAAAVLGIPAEAAASAAGAELVKFGASVRFRHPLVRSAAYQSASPQQRQDVHRALAKATDPQIDPDRRASHRAQAAAGPHEDVTAELERSAGRAQARGGLAAAASFLERAAVHTRTRSAGAAAARGGAHQARRGRAACGAGAAGSAGGGPPDALRSRSPTPPRVVDVLLDAFALRLTEGYAEAARHWPGPLSCFSLSLRQLMPSLSLVEGWRTRWPSDL